MYKYYFVNQQVAPKKAALAHAKEELAMTEAALGAAKQKLQDVVNGLDMLNKKLTAKMTFKEEKQKNIQLCEDRLNRAFRLITGQTISYIMKVFDSRIQYMKIIF